MKKSKSEIHWGLSVLLALVLTVIIHYLFLSNINFHSTIQVIFGILIYMIVLTCIVELFERFLVR